MKGEVIIQGISADALVSAIRKEIDDALPAHGVDYLVDRKWLWVNFKWRKAKIDKLIEQKKIMKQFCEHESKTDLFSLNECRKYYKSR